MKKVCISYDTGHGRLGGHFAQFSFTGLPGVEIAALADSNPEAQKTFRMTGAKRLYSNYIEMMDQEHPDIVVLCSRLPQEHYDQIKYAVSHQCHVLCEKPLVADLLQADELIDLAHNANVKVQIAHLARFAPAFQEMKRRIEAGEIGRVLSCYMRGKEDHRGGGEDMIVLGTHLMDIACAMFGLPDKVFSCIRYQNMPIKERDLLKTDEPVGPCAGDEIYSLYRFPNGVNGIFESRRGMERGVARMGIVVAGTKGAFSVRYSGERRLRISRNFPVPMEDEAGFADFPLEALPEIRDAEAFDYDKYGLNRQSAAHRYYADNNRRAAWNLLQAIDHDEPLLAGIESAVDSLEMIVGAYRSALTDRPVYLPQKERNHPLLKKE